MPVIGHVIRTSNGGFKGQLKSLSIKTDILIHPNDHKTSDAQPHFCVLAGDIEIGAGWIRRSQVSGRDYVSISLAAPEFGPRRIYANLARAAGGGEDSFVLIWNPVD
ncbi:MAG TPA: DUF736 family protein [Sphingomicrobium sp.]|nr:DUF736 family protein [Sphingomicrobium sp.]